MKKQRFVSLAVVTLLFLSGCGKNQEPPTTVPQNTVVREEQAIPGTTQPPETAAPETTAATTEAPTEQATEATSALADGLRPEFKEAMDTYEAFYTEYCDLLKKYAENPTDLSILGKYTNMLTKVEEMNKAFEKWDESDLNSEELKYYLDVNNRVMKMLVDVAGNG